MLGKKLPYLALLGVWLYCPETYAQKPAVQTLTIDWPNGYQPESCKLLQSPDHSQSWWVCRNATSSPEAGLGFARLNTDQSKSAGFLVSYNQFKKLFNTSQKSHSFFYDVTDQGNFLVHVESDNEDKFSLIQFSDVQPKILWSVQLKQPKDLVWLESLKADANQGFVLLWDKTEELVDQSYLQQIDKDGKLVWSYQNATISAFQGKTLVWEDVMDDFRQYAGVPGLRWEKRLVITSNGNIAVWGNAYKRKINEGKEATGYFGEFRTCLTASGELIKEIRDSWRTESSDDAYTQIIALKNGNWLKIQRAAEESLIKQDRRKGNVTLVQYNDHCDQINSQSIRLPSHHFPPQRSFGTVKAAMPLNDEQFMIAYAQGEDRNSLYVALIDLKKGILWDQAIIAPEDADADRLISDVDARGRYQDFLEVNLGLLPNQKSVLVSLHMPEQMDHSDEHNVMPVFDKLYRVALPAIEK